MRRKIPLTIYTFSFHLHEDSKKQAIIPILQVMKYGKLTKRNYPGTTPDGAECNLVQCYCDIFVV